MALFNMHLTGDFHAVTAAHNLLAAIVDNHLFQGNALGLDIHGLAWRRVLDVNDRALRNVVIGLGGAEDGVPRQSGFDITAASEVMAVLSLATSVADLRARLARIVVGCTKGREPVTAAQLHAAGAMAAILEETDVVVEATSTYHNATQNSLDRWVCLVDWSGERVTVWPNSYEAHQTRMHLTEMLGLPLKDVRVVSPFVGGQFGRDDHHALFRAGRRPRRLRRSQHVQAQVRARRGERGRLQELRPQGEGLPNRSLAEVLPAGAERISWKEKRHPPGEGPLADGVKEAGRRFLVPPGLACGVAGGSPGRGAGEGHLEPRRQCDPRRAEPGDRHGLEDLQRARLRGGATTRCPPGGSVPGG